ncbi:MAG: hypothetical protein Q4C77_07490 [Eubacteriales bacterium]|nr:hypothetical protein [Eubacteriales bacterium]
MNKRLHDIGKFYSSIFMGNIGLFLFIGLLSVIFQEQGWFPNEKLYNISQLVYEVVLPTCIGYVGGEKIAGRSGGILAVLMVAGVLTADVHVGILAAMIAGPVGGAVWKYAGSRMKERVGSSLQMLAGNLLIGILGSLLAVLGYYILEPAVTWWAEGISGCLKALIEHRLLLLANVFIEPMKVFFLNNIVNHGMLVPLGMNQIQEGGKSVLFLLESNPGPGFGMLLALFLTQRERRGEYGTALFAQGAGGIHEVYFPYVLANLWLLLPLIAGGAAGTLCFELLHVGVTAPVSPGSIITILIMAGKENLLTAAGGIAVSAAVSFAGSLLVLGFRRQRRENSKPMKESTEKLTEEPIEESTEKPTEKPTEELTEELIEEPIVEPIKEETRMPLKNIGFVCDAGVGSSAMGAALFRRKLAQNGIQGVAVQAYASDQIPKSLDLIVCQKDFLRLLPDGTKEMEIFAVDSLMGGEAFDKLINTIKERNR